MFDLDIIAVQRVRLYHINNISLIQSKCFLIINHSLSTTTTTKKDQSGNVFLMELRFARNRCMENNAPKKLIPIEIFLMIAQRLLHPTHINKTICHSSILLGYSSFQFHIYFLSLLNTHI